MVMNAKEYFLSQRPDSGSLRALYTRIANAMNLHNGITMNQLCEMSGKELEKMRSIGDKARAVIIEECRNYSVNIK